MCPNCSPAQGRAHPVQLKGALPAHLPATFTPTPQAPPQGPPLEVASSFPVGATAADPTSEVRLPTQTRPAADDTPGAEAIKLDDGWLA